MKTAIWFTNDLRASDNKAMSYAVANRHEIVAIFLKDKKMAQFQLDFLNQSLNDLASQLKPLDVPIYIFEKDDNEEIKKFFTENKIDSVSTAKAFNSKKKAWQHKMQQLLPEVNFHYFNSETLVDLELHNLTSENINDNFTAFRKKIEANWIINPTLAISLIAQKHIEIKSDFEKNRLIPSSDTPSSQFKGGRSEGLKRLKYYLFESQKILNYKDTRNGMIEFDDSSKFSPWLAWGCISAKEIYWQIQKFESEVKKNESTYWMVFELLWRDYFKFLAEKYGDKLFSPYGLQKITDSHLTQTNKSKLENQKIFESWKLGKTSDPFINANMIELLHTGWMSNRGRQNVANYLVKTLNIDWTIGAEWFSEMLIDYDCENNWGNWLYQSGYGTDPRNRVFNPKLQAQMYDPKSEYIQKWLIKEDINHGI